MKTGTYIYSDGTYSEEIDRFYTESGSYVEKNLFYSH